MGYTRHHAIIVTTFCEEAAQDAHTKAEEIFSPSLKAFRQTPIAVTPIVADGINGYSTFLVAPDGSKEGWEPSDEGDRRRKRFVEWLESRAFSDGSSVYDWALVQYGDDEDNNELLRSEADLPKRFLRARAPSARTN